jgi:acetoin utilization protein AcuB
MSVLSSKEHAPEGFRRIYIRTYNIDREKLDTLKAALMENTQLLYVVDHRENSRMIFQ